MVKIMCPVCGLVFEAKPDKNRMVECPKGCGYFSFSWAKNYEHFLSEWKPEDWKKREED